MGYFLAWGLGFALGMVLVAGVIDSPVEASCTEACAEKGFPSGETRRVSQQNQCWCFDAEKAERVTPLAYGWSK